MAGEGAVLKKAREEKGLSYQEVEDSIKIRVRYLEALENENYGVLPGTTYTRGFLRTYAKHLGINPQEIIDSYNASLVKEAEPDIEPRLSPIPSNQVWFRPVVLAGMAILAVIIVVGIIFVSNLGNKSGTFHYTPTPLPAAPKASDQNTADSGMGQDTNTVGQEQNAGQPSQPQTEQYEGIVVELTFTADCWVVVNVDGKQALSGTIPSGKMQTLQADKQIEFVSIGNAGGLSLKVNGHTIPPLGKTGDVLQNYIIDENKVKELAGS
ncbi:RodZ domain-containing protein [Dehalobacter sp. TBBPA1]|uniref:helix-turn-helix domain-containing protein n=1 Tax=Dehalobacter sp. TBBPA1 TaxID=3235037 RepID=UPI0034A40127